MSEVKRYEPEEVLKDRWERAGMDEVEGGDYVHWDDYAALEAELAKLEAGMPRLMQANYDLRQERDAALAECERLRELLRDKFPRIDPCQPLPLDEKAHCCEYTIYVERERLHRAMQEALSAKP